MNPNTVTRKSKKLSWLLRHGAGSEGLSMDAAGFVPVAEVLERLRMSRAELEVIVARNNKRRLQLEGDRIRCCQGHSTEDMPVTREALEDSWVRWGGGIVWHGTSVDAVAPIAAEGIVPQRRTHVHLAPALQSVVGKRAAVHVMLAVDPERMAAAGLGLWAAPNGVVLARRVPPGCITEVRPMTRRAHARAAELRGYFDLAA